MQYLLRRASLTAEDAFAFLKTDNDGDHITFMGFCETLRQVCRICNAVNHIPMTALLSLMFTEFSLS
jgi:hypothetical protein